jgi:hypothetical protein
MQALKSQTGSSIIEFLLGLLILTPIIGAAVSNFGTLAKSQRLLLNTASDYHSLFKTDAFLSRLVRESDHHSIPNLAVVHLNGQIKYGLGSLNPVTTRTDDKRPSSRSDAISQISLSIKNTMNISNVYQQAGIYSLQGCPKYPGQDITFSQNSRSYLAVGTYGMTEFIADRISLNGVALGCWEFKGSPTDGMILKANAPDLTFTRYLIPIDKIYTIYSDSLDRLRFIGHEGLDNKENQPLSDGSINVKLRILNWPTPHHEALEATYWPTSSRELTQFYPSRLAKRSILDFLLN